MQRPPPDPQALSRFHDPSRSWFQETLGAPTRAQTLAWEAVGTGESALLSAPTGSGKTLAAFFTAIDRLAFAPHSGAEERCRVLYVSPLKALVVDIERNLRAPLTGIAGQARKLGVKVNDLRVAVRTGDTPAPERTRIFRDPPDILVTTPESLFLMLASRARSVLAHVDTLIVDEIHQLAGSKRGAHLFVSLERLELLRRIARGKSCTPLQRVGLSATQRPLTVIAELLAGHEDGRPRPVRVVEARLAKTFVVTVALPEGAFDRPAHPGEGEPRSASAWPLLHARLLEAIRARRSTMVFVNSRRLAERLASALNELDAERTGEPPEGRPPLVLAHHGSLAREAREDIEDRLKRGELRGIVATSSLELGIDMGAVDQVVQIEAPPSIAAGIQRIGRAGHQVGAVSRGLILPKHRADLLAATAAKEAIEAGDIEPTVPPRNPLDVLAQQIVAIVASGLGPPPVPSRGSAAEPGEPPAEQEPVHVDVLYTLICRAGSFATLPRGAFEGVLDMLSGKYPSADFSELRPRVTWDRRAGLLTPRPSAARLAILNAGTIPERGLYGVFLEGGRGEDARRSRRVGELDEEMVYELREGEVFFLGASSWQVVEITRDRVMVQPAHGRPGKTPFWHGDRAGRPLGFGQRIGALTRRLASISEEGARAWLQGERGLDPHAAGELARYVHSELEATGHVPTDRAVVIERYQDDLGDHRVCILSPLGARVHAPWAMVVRARLASLCPGEVEILWNDDGIALRVPEGDGPPPLEALLPDPERVRDQVIAELGHTALFAARFREAAGRALLLPKRHPGKRTALWALRKRASDLLSVASRYPSFPLMLEVHRECLLDVFDMDGLTDLLTGIRAEEIRVHLVEPRAPSPFARSLVFSFAAQFIYDGDAPLAERRAQALLVDPEELRALLGEEELRKLLDPGIVRAHASLLRREEHPLTSADNLHDLLLFLGDLGDAEISSRCQDKAQAGRFTQELVDAGRAIRARLAGTSRLVAVEDAARLRDAFGVPLPDGLPPELQAPAHEALRGWLGRYARTHGPFTASEVARRYGLDGEAVDPTMEPLVREGRVVRGAFLAHPDGSSEYCDREVLRVLRRKTLSALREEIEPVDAATFARFSMAWSQIQPLPEAHSPPREPHRARDLDRLLEAITRLQGCPIPFSALEAEVLPARVPGFQPWSLDALIGSGEVCWTGIEALGPSDGRIALYLAEDEPLLRPASPEISLSPLADRMRSLFEARGALFFGDVVRGLGGFPRELVTALHELVWAGLVTNDTLEPLRSMLGAPRASGRPHRRQGRLGARPVRIPGTEGRWSVRGPPLAQDGAPLPSPTPTERRAALARTLLDRHGVLLRESVAAELVPGGFSSVYDVLSAMEDRGQVRRGYFVDGRGTAQFARPGAEDRLRSCRDLTEERLFSLSAVDPANPYGAALPWPASPEPGRPSRSSGARVILEGGRLTAWLSRSADTLVTFPGSFEDDPVHAADAAARGLARLLASSRLRALELRTVDGVPAAEHPWLASLLRRGFILRGDLLVLSRSPDPRPGGAEATVRPA